MTREAFENAIVINSAIGGSTNAPIHLNAIARHLGVKLDNDDWQTIGHKIPLLVNLQPAGEYLGEDYHRAGGVPAVVHGTDEGRPFAASGRRSPPMANRWATIAPMAENLNPDVIKTVANPLKKEAGFINLQGQSVRQRHHEDQRDFAGIPRALSVATRPIPKPSKARRRCSTARKITMPASTIEALGLDENTHPVHARRRAGRLSGRGRSRQHAAAGLSVEEAASMRCPASAMAASPARPVRRPSSMPRRKRRSAAAWRCSNRRPRAH